MNNQQDDRFEHSADDYERSPTAKREWWATQPFVKNCISKEELKVAVLLLADTYEGLTRDDFTSWLKYYSKSHVSSRKEALLRIVAKRAKSLLNKTVLEVIQDGVL